MDFQASPVAQKSRGCVPVQLLPIAAANFYGNSRGGNCGTPEPVASFLVCMTSKATFETPLQNHIAVFDPH
jgi:hypothetical protein